MEEVVRSKSERISGKARRMDSRSLRPPPEAQESTKVHLPFFRQKSMIPSHRA